ncbi:MAG: hypothetical protein ACRCTY_05855, partial [Candidatus Adiutrix sp.]
MLNKLHQEPSGQVAIYEAEHRYKQLLEHRFGEKFLAYRKNWQTRSRRKEVGPFPLSLDLAINSGCQLSCQMCP